MHEHFTSGAINKATLEYVFPSIASKDHKYSCPHCKNDVTLRKGKVRVHHFAHKKEVSSCTYYSKPTRNHLIYDLKMAMHTIYNKRKQPIWFINKCINRNCGTETISALSLNSMTCPVLRIDKSSNYIIFENSRLQSREEIIKEVEYKYENSIESIEKNLIIKEIKELEESNKTLISSIASPFHMRSIFDVENNGNDDIPTTRIDLRITDDDIEELNKMLEDSMSHWKVHISKSRAAGTVYFYNKISKDTTWNTPTDVLREEEVLIANRKLVKIDALKKELTAMVENEKRKIKEDIDMTIKEQEQKRLTILEISHDNANENDFTTSDGAGLETIKIPGLDVKYYHKHLVVNAVTLMDTYETYMKEDEANGSSSPDISSKKEIDASSIPSMKVPFKLRCRQYSNYVCTNCKNKQEALRQKEESIRKLFYLKYPMYSRDQPALSYRTSNSPPTVKAEEAKKRKMLLLRRARENHKYMEFRENYLMEERRRLRIPYTDTGTSCA